MKRKKYAPVAAAFAALILLVLILLVQGNLNHAAKVVLPDEDATEENNTSGNPEKEQIYRIEIRPETVQRAIETLSRPENYSCRITIERYFAEDSATTDAQVSVAGPWTRIDLSQSPNHTERHAIISEDRCYIWYDDNGKYFTAKEPFSADEELGIPTYEHILRYPIAEIAVADYRLLNTQECIYVETAPDDAGYVERCYVNVQSGLLCAAERMQGNAVIYRMAMSNLDTGNVDEQAFTLPDGTVLFDPQTQSDDAKKD